VVRKTDLRVMMNKQRRWGVVVEVKCIVSIWTVFWFCCLTCRPRGVQVSVFLIDTKLLRDGYEKIGAMLHFDTLPLQHEGGPPQSFLPIRHQPLLSRGRQLESSSFQGRCFLHEKAPPQPLDPFSFSCLLILHLFFLSPTSLRPVWVKVP
jgi:hypothetical protein